MKNKFIRNTLILSVVSLVVIAVPTLLTFTGIMDAYSSGVFALAGIYAIMAISVNIISGITGQLSLGQAGFMALGAYATILLNTNAHIPLPLAVVCAGLITAFLWFFDWFSNVKAGGRLSCDCYACFWRDYPRYSCEFKAVDWRT